MSKAPKDQTVTQKTELPPWVNTASKNLWSNIRTTSNNMDSPWSGSLFPGVNGDMTSAWDMVRNAQGTGQGAVNEAMDGSRSSMYYSPESVYAQNFLGGDISAYMNPWLQNVEASALDNLERQRQLSLTQTGDQAVSSGAFGGSRHGIREGVTNSETARAAGDISGQLRAQGFNTASSLMMSDMDRALTAGMSNQNAGLTANQQRMLASQILAGQGGQLSDMKYRDAAMREAIGQQQFSLEQQRLQDQQRQYETQRMAALEPYNIQLAALQGLPYGGSSSTTGPAQYQGSNWGMSALGGFGSGLSLANSLGMAAGGMGSWGMGGLGALLGLFSDEREKTDIRKLGKDPDTGLDVYAYRYKGDPKSYPKVVGPMAQDVEKTYPGSVTEIGGKKVVKNLGFGGI
jgi:hypothetical protein